MSRRKVWKERVPAESQAAEVKGLRPSDPMTTYEVRFSPLVTLPVLLQISSGNFSRRVAWSTLPASILSVPEGPGRHGALQMLFARDAL